nr:DUF6506 family protein [Biomaibacter acetigenes]
MVGVKDYKSAADVARELVEQGIGAIELCGGFGIEGAAMVKRAAGEKSSGRSGAF